MTKERSYPTALSSRESVLENNLFPIFLKLDSLRLLLVGGGAVAHEKLGALLRNTTTRSVKVVADRISPELEALALGAEGVALLEKEYSSDDLDDADVVFCAVDDPLVSRQVREDARQRGLLVNVADQPAHCDFYLGAVVQKGQLKIAISTNGQSPTMARRLKEVLNDYLPEALEVSLHHLGSLRKKLEGDFTARVGRLNELTQVLVAEQSPGKNGRYWRKVAYACLFALFFLLAGNVIAQYATVQDIGKGARWLYGQTDGQFYLVVLAGFLAQLVDGALGMGYGVTCTSVLLTVGVPLPAISGSIHTAEIFSSGASGFTHYKFGNVNKRLLRWILVPGMAGAFLGAWLLSRLGGEYAVYVRPVLAVYTLFLGARIIRNAFRKRKQKNKLKRVGWLGLSGGFLDSFGGGGWGPLVTSTLIAKGKTPRYVIGTVSLAEFFVTLTSAFTFFTMIGISHWLVITGLIIGGLAAAPVAAKLAGKLPQKASFIAVGALIVIWSLHILLRLL